MPRRAASGHDDRRQPGKLPPPPLDGELRFDAESRTAAADDFGHIVHRSPAGILLPGSDEDVATTIRWAARSRRRDKATRCIAAHRSVPASSST